MNILLWVLQILTALLYSASGIMKIFMFEQISKDMPSFAVLPRQAWLAMGIIELVCVVGLIVPSAFRWRGGAALTAVAALVLALESLVFVGVHIKSQEIGPMIMSAVLGLIMAFIAYGRMYLKPIV